MSKHMKIQIWIHKDEAVTGKITKYHFQCPQPGYTNYVQVEITQDYFVQLEDKRKTLTYPEFRDKHYPNTNTPTPPCNDIGDEDYDELDQDEQPFAD